MPHVGVKRLGAGDAQKHRAEHGEADPAVMRSESRRPARGSKARSTCGASGMCIAPSAPIVRKNTIMIGPKKAATRAVPWLCTQNSVTRITIVIGMTYSVSRW